MKSARTSPNISALPSKPSLRERASALKASVTRVIRREPTDEEREAPDSNVDWHSPPPGFMAYPAIEPQGFINIAEGLKLEAQRLHDIAADELERLSEAYRAGPAGNTANDWIANHRRRLRVDELSAAASPKRAEPAGDDQSDPGFVLYEDAGGTTHRRPIAHWISFMAARLSAIAGIELNRQFNAACRNEPDQDGNALYDRLRRELRIDALHDLAFRWEQVFEASKEYAIGRVPIRLCFGSDAKPITANPFQAAGLTGLAAEILSGWVEWARLNGEGEIADAAGDYPSERLRDRLLDAAEALPTTPENLPAKALALAWMDYVELWRRGWTRDQYGYDGRLATDIHAAITQNAKGA